MALQLSSASLRRSLVTSKNKVSLFSGIGTDVTSRRFKSTDAGDVIGIDLGTTNSCVAVMVSQRLMSVHYNNMLSLLF